MVSYGMRKIVTTMHVTINGKTARPDGNIDWVSGHPDTFDWDGFDGVDACVLGRNMVGEFAEYWLSVGADSPEPDQRYAEWAKRTPHYVLSGSAAEFEWPDARALRSLDELAALRNEPGGKIFVIGGARTVGAALDAGLIDELRLTVHPVVVGEGSSLFDTVRTDRQFRLSHSQELGDGSVRLVFVRDQERHRE